MAAARLSAAGAGCVALLGPGPVCSQQSRWEQKQAWASPVLIAVVAAV